MNKDYKADSEAIEPKAASKNSDDEADDLADMLGQLGVSASRRCQVCQTVYVLSQTWLTFADVICRLPSSTTGSHCSDCTVLADKARRKSNAPSSSDLPPDSAKIRKILELLRKVDERDDAEKTIIFSQFTSMLDLIQPFLKDQGIKHVRCELMSLISVRVG